MSGSNWSFKDNLTIDNSKYLKWQGTSSIKNIIGLDSNNDLNINSGGRDIYINSSSANSVTYINKSNASPVLIGTNMSIGISTTDWNQAGNNAPTLCLSNSTTPYIATASSGGLGLVAGVSFDTSSGSLILLNTSANIYASNNTAGNVNIYTGNESLKFQVLSSGTTNIIPDGTTIALSIAQNNTILSTPLRITNTNESYSSTTGALQIAGGIGIQGNTHIDGTLSISSVTGNINFNSSTPSTSYSSGTIFFTGGLGIECSLPAANQYSGGGISCAGGLALGQNAMIAGNVTVFNSSSSLDSQSGSIIAYGGIGINGQTNIRSQVSPQIRIAPISSGAESSIYFSSQNNYTTTGSWKIGQNTGSIGTGNFAFVNANNGNFVSFNDSSAYITLHKNIFANDTLTFTATNGNLINFGELFSIGSSSGNFLINRTGGNSALSIQLTTGNVILSSTENSTTEYSGAVVISGGTGIAKDLYVGGDIFSNGTLNLGGGASVSPGGASTFSYLTITSSDASDSIVNGSVVTFGGISIQCTDNSTSPSSGNGLTVAGGVGIYKDLYVGGTSYLPIINSSTSNLHTIISTNVSSINLIVSNATFGSTVFTNANLVDLQAIRITSAELLITGLASIGNLKASSSTFGNTVITNTSTSNLNATGISSSNILVTGLASTNNLTVSSSTLGNAVITNTSTGTLDAIGITSSSLLVTGLVSINNLFSSSSTLASVVITNTSTGTLDVIGITSQNLLLTNGSISNLITTSFTVSNVVANNITTSSLITLNGSISNLISSSFTGSNMLITNATINNIISNTLVSYNTVDFKSTSNSTSITQGGNLTVLGGASIFKDLYVGGNIIGVQTGTTFNNLYINSTSNSLGVGSGGSLSVLGGASVSNDLYIGGNLGIGNTTTILPQQIVEVTPVTYTSNQDGGIRVSTKNPISVNDPSYRYIDLRLQSDPTSNFKGIIVGSLVGGVAAEQEYIGFSQDNSTYIYSEAKFTDGTSCSNSSTASVVMSGGLSINCFTNATTVSNGGALTVAGGVAIAGDLIIGGSITYADAAQASNTYAYLTLTASDPSDNLANGALVTFGGISIQSTFNATSATSGGGLTIAGGMGVGADIYVEGTSYLPTISSGNIVITNSSLSNVYITSGDSSINSSTGSFISNAGISINCSTNATSVTRGGALTIAGGASIYKDLYVGGTVTSSSDIRLKTNIRELPSVLDKLDNIRTVYYNNKVGDKLNHIGFLAQDFENEFPELLKHDSADAYYALDYSRVTVLLMKCIKELKSEIQMLKM